MKLFAPVALLVVALCAVAFWDNAPPRADLVLVNRGEVFTLDPQRMSYTQDFRLAHALYEPLVRWNNRDMTIEPAAAGLPVLSDDKRTYAFTIREDARWSNGEPVTSHDYVYSWQRLLFPDTAADYSNLLFVIEGAEEFFNWRSVQLADFVADPNLRSAEELWNQAQDHFRQTVRIRAVDERTFEVRLRRPTAYFLDLVAFAAAHPVHRPTVEGWPASPHESSESWFRQREPAWADRQFVKLNSVTGRLEQKHDWCRPGVLVSNGPYVLDQWRYKRDLRLTKNPHYHSPGIIRSDSVQLVAIEDANTAVLAFESGQIDWLSDVGVEYAGDMLVQKRAGGRSDIHAFPTFGADFYSFNCRAQLADGRPNPFAHPRVRRAFSMSVDKNAIVQSATRLNEPVISTLIPPGSIAGYESPSGLPYDIHRARAELAAAGWDDRDRDGLIENNAGHPFPIIDLLYTSNSSRYKWISLALKSQWEGALGVRIELRTADTKFYKEDLKQGKFMIARGRWYGDYADPTSFLEINKTRDGNNDRGFSDATFDAILQDAADETDAATRLKLLAEAERLLLEEHAPLVPLCQLVQLYMFRPGEFRGLTDHPMLVQYLWQIEAAR